MNKDFDRWNDIKKKINAESHVPLFKEREIWWASIGVNIGHESDGKSRQFTRPILILRKFNNKLFWGIPLTTKVKNIKHYHKFIYQEKEQCAMLTQLRLWDANRLVDKMGRISHVEQKNIKNKLSDYLK